ncbi:MAG TPA: SHOCT domain-containing protein [Opitutaceae bacterium]
MNTSTLRGIILGSCLCLATSTFAKSPPPPPVSLGNNTYSIRREAGTAFMRDVDKLKEQCTDAATKFCASQGRQLKVLSLEGKAPTFGTGYAYAKIVFKALNPGDLELTEPVAMPGQPAAPVYAQRHLTTDELYDQLTKLDDLRKKGILTDEEFQAQKKKLLERAN